VLPINPTSASSRLDLQAVALVSAITIGYKLTVHPKGFLSGGFNDRVRFVAAL